MPLPNARVTKIKEQESQTMLDRLIEIMVKPVRVLGKTKLALVGGGEPAKCGWSSFVLWIYQQTIE